VTKDNYYRWAEVFTDAQTRKAITGAKRVLSKYGNLAYDHPAPPTLAALVERLSERTPPIMAMIDGDGSPNIQKTAISHILLSGWIFWLGRKCFKDGEALDFFDTNRLCDHALLQQRAINMAITSAAKAR
jgi:hypothetical protein